MSYRNDDGGCLAVILVVFTVLVMVAVSYGIGRKDELRYWESQLIERGVAEWYADPKTGVRELKWKCGEVPHEQAD